MTCVKFNSLLFVALVGLIGCSSPNALNSPGIPDPIVVLENPDTGDRVRLFKEIPFKVPADYDEKKHIADWTATQNENGFTKTISPEEDRQQLAELREKNLAASKGAKQK